MIGDGDVLTLGWDVLTLGWDILTLGGDVLTLGGGVFTWGRFYFVLFVFFRCWQGKVTVKMSARNPPRSPEEVGILFICVYH